MDNTLDDTTVDDNTVDDNDACTTLICPKSVLMLGFLCLQHSFVRRGSTAIVTTTNACSHRIARCMKN